MHMQLAALNRLDRCEKSQLPYHNPKHLQPIREAFLDRSVLANTGADISKSLALLEDVFTLCSVVHFHI